MPRGVISRFQSTLPLRGATLRIRHIRIHNGISIHAPLAGSDHFRTGQVFSGYYFNPRSPCGERHRLITGMETCLEFQSTLPLRGATYEQEYELTYNIISIHAPLAGSDMKTYVHYTDDMNFNPRSPCGERPVLSVFSVAALDFNPRSPCGERRQDSKRGFRTYQFQSTLPLRGATAQTFLGEGRLRISIHAPLAGSDSGYSADFNGLENFNPRSPCGERPERSCQEV